MKIKVNRLKLIKAFEQKVNAFKRIDLKPEPAADLKPYLNKFETRLKAFTKQFEKRVNALRMAKTVDDFNKAANGLDDDFYCDLGPNPAWIETKETEDHSHEIRSIERMVKALKLSNQDEIDAEDSEDYLRYL